MEASPEAVNRVLVVDSDTDLHEDIAEWLHDFDDVVLSFATFSTAALKLWQSQHHHVVICNARLGRDSGLGLLATIIKADPDTQVMLISESDDSEEVVSALRLGAADFIRKPFDSTVLVHAVFRGLAEYRLKQENRRYRYELEQKNRKLNDSLRLLREDQEAGRAVQAKLLPPRNTTFNGVDLEYILSPSLYLSGDFIDYFRLSESKFGFYLADVSGHGAASAFVTILLKTLANRMRVKYRQKGMPELTTAQILKIANQELIPLKLGKHLAVFCAVIDTEQQELHYASAAHFPPPILLNDGEPQLLRGKGLPVGLFAHAEYDEIRIPLEKRFHLTAFSDGVLEFIDLPTMADKETYLLEMLSKQNHTVASVLDAMAIDVNEPAPDDLAVLMVSQGY